MSPVRVPAGREIEIRAGATVASVVEVGGGLRSFSVAGRPVLDGYGPQQMCTAGRGQLLVPWPNRLAGGSYSFQGTDLQLPLNDAGTGSAIHGLARWQRWELRRPAPDACVASLQLPAQPGWPFLLDLTVTYVVAPGRLEVTVSGTNAGDGPCPYGAGQHPYLSVPVDATTLRLPALTRLELERGIPTGHRLPAQRVLAPIGDRRLDDCFCDLEDTEPMPDPAEGGRWVVEAEPPDGPLLRLWGSSAWRYLQVFSGDTVPEVHRRRQGLALEPMTCPPNAFVTGEGLVVLQPGERYLARWGIEVGAEAGARP